MEDVSGLFCSCCGIEFGVTVEHNLETYIRLESKDGKVTRLKLCSLCSKKVFTSLTNINSKLLRNEA